MNTATPKSDLKSGDVAKLWDMIRDIKVAMMTTHDEHGCLHSRPMANHQGDFDGSLWFFTWVDSAKVFEVNREHQVNLSFADPNAQNYVSVSGPANLVRDKDKIRQLWSEYLATWFPKGVDDPNIALLKVDIERAEYWDSPSSTMIHAFGYVKSKLTGEPPSPGENKKLNLG